MEKPVISVIITAYNRRRFLKQAVKSVLTQTVDKSLYEIIVVKNFRDPDIDNINGITNIMLGDEPVGTYLAEGIKHARGEIISFLDDEDLYRANKLEYVLKVFSTSEDIVYFHHNMVFIDDANKILGFGHGPFKDIELKYNNIISRVKCEIILQIGAVMSAISVRSRIFDKNVLKALSRLYAFIDYFVFLIALKSKGTIVHRNVYLSFYRLHGEQISKPKGRDPVSTLIKFARSAFYHYSSYEYLRELFNEASPYCFLGSFYYILPGLCISLRDRKTLARVTWYTILKAIHDGSWARTLALF